MSEKYNKYDDKGYRTALGKVFTLHVIMFFVTFTGAVMSRSSSLLADSLDFIGDAASYALGLFVIRRGIMVRATVSIAKAVTMLGFGVTVMIYSLVRFKQGVTPDYNIMNWVGILGIIAHVYCIIMLYRFRSGDSNRLSVWICTINDLLSNIITVAASQIVRVTDSVIPDIAAAGIIVSIAVIGAIVILRQAIHEIREYKSTRNCI